MKIVRPITINNARLLSSNVPENDYPAWDSGETVGLGARRIYVVGEHHWVVESLQAGNTGHTPTGDNTNDEWWLLIGNTNRWRMFDESISSTTSNPEEIIVELKNLGPMDSIVLLNVDAATVRIEITDNAAGVVFDETYTMIGNRGVTDWFTFFYEPYEAKTVLLDTSLPKYINAITKITISKPGAVASVGACIVGLSKTMGDTRLGGKVGIQDYSVKQRDDFGNFTILERAFSNYATLDVWVESGQADKIMRILTGYRATPVVYVGDESRESTFIYGYYKDFYETIEYDKYSLYSLELESLT